MKKKPPRVEPQGHSPWHPTSRPSGATSRPNVGAFIHGHSPWPSAAGGRVPRRSLKTSSAKNLKTRSTSRIPTRTTSRSIPKMSKKDFGEKIDIFCHILPPKTKEVLFKKAMPCNYIDTDSGRPALFDLDMRFRAMDQFEGLRQVLALGLPPLEYVLSPGDATDLARMANDEMAELVNRYPDRFVAAVAGLPLNDIDASLRETERTVRELKFKGIQIFSSINGKPLDRDEFMGLYEMMSGYDLPIWIHPARDKIVPDYPDEAYSKYTLFTAFGWPYETTLAMARLVFTGILEKYPMIKFITHHCGAMIPFFSKRVLLVREGPEPGKGTPLTHPPLEYFKKFYADTVLGGSTPALMCGHAFFGADHLLFGSDYPYPGGAERGDAALGEVIRSVEMMDIPKEEKTGIFSTNARRILRLP
jgi:predicted TIM-barrel fold metal-dependent hydrolase